IADQMAIREGLNPLDYPFGHARGLPSHPVDSTIQIMTVPADDVIPIAGDSSGPVDEIMEPPAGYRPVALLTAPGHSHDAPAALPPFIVGVARAGQIELRVISPKGLSKAEWRQVVARPLLIAPLGRDGASALEQQMAPLLQHGSGTHVARLKTRAFCVEE